MADPRTAAPLIYRKYVVPGVNQAEAGVSEALDIAGVALGSGSTSYLYRELVTRQGLASQVSTWYQGDTLDHGELSISISPAPGADVAKVEEALDAALARLAADGFDPALVERSRNQLVASTIYGLDSQFRLAYLFGSAFAIGRSVEDTLGWTDRIRQITPEQVSAAAREYLRIERSATGVLVPERSKAAAAAATAN
jgi:zinc protease